MHVTAIERPQVSVSYLVFLTHGKLVRASQPPSLPPSLLGQKRKLVLFCDCCFLLLAANVRGPSLLARKASCLICLESARVWKQLEWSLYRVFFPIRR